MANWDFILLIFQLIIIEVVLIDKSAMEKSISLSPKIVLLW